MKAEYQQQKQQKSYKLMETQWLTAGLKKKWTKQKLRKKIKDFLELNEKDIYLDLQNIMNIMKAQSTYISFIPESSTIKRNHTQKSR